MLESAREFRPEYAGEASAEVPLSTPAGDVPQMMGQVLLQDAQLTSEPVGDPDAEPRASILDPSLSDTPVRARRTGKTGSRPNRTSPLQDDGLSQYLEQIGLIPILDKAGEATLAEAIEKGIAARAELDSIPEEQRHSAHARQLKRDIQAGELATEQFTQANLRLVVSIAKRYQSKGLLLLDLIQEGNLGLMRAVQKFDHHKGFRFSTYATWWIKQYIDRGITNTGATIRLPVNASDKRRDIITTKKRLEKQFGRPATIKEIASELGRPPEKVAAILDYQKDLLSLNQQLLVGEDGSGELGDFIEDKGQPSVPQQVLTRQLPAEIDRLLAPLSKRDREIIKFHYGIGTGNEETLLTTAKKFGLSRERIRQIEKESTVKLRRIHKGFELSDILEE